MKEHANRYIYPDLHLFRSKKVRRLGLVITILAVAVVVMLLIPTIQRYGLAQKFVNELYTTTQEDLIDPSARVERLRKLATEEVVDELLKTDGIPAVVLHESGKNVLTYYEKRPRAIGQNPEPELWTDEIPGAIRIDDKKNNQLIAGWRGVVGIRLGRVGGRYYVVDMSPINWQELYRP